MQTVKVAGRSHALGKRIGRGGEGEVYGIEGRPDGAVKIYRHDLRAQREPKVRAMVEAALAASTNLVTFPSAVATDARGAFVGFLMRLVSGYQPLHELYSPKSRRTAFPNADYRFVVRSALNVARAVAQVHQTGCIIGDFNHSGVLVSTDATVALIDADSFQFIAKGKRFACVVGVPDFTPPELHGADLRTIERTKAHDNFGLAVALFHLLAMGKHPYAGRFAGGDISMGDAIAQNRFAFSRIRKAETRTTPPPASITLSDLPTPVASAFEAAFGTSPAARPDAAAWVHLLNELEGGLSHCTRVKSHYFPTAAGKCTWCRIVEQSAIDMFPDLQVRPTDAPPGAPFDLECILAQVRAVRLPEAAALLPRVAEAAGEPSEGVRKAKSAVQASKALGVVALIGAVAGFAYESALAVIWIAIGIFGLFRLAGGSVEQAPFRRAYEQADQRARKAELAFLQRIGLTELVSVREDVERRIGEYRRVDQDLNRELAQLKSTREARQRDTFLDGFTIRRASIPGIGPAKTATLASYGVETAADVIAAKVRVVPGFGEALTAKMLAWRRGHEAKFRYNPAADASDVQAESAIRSASAKNRTDLQAKIRSGAAALQAAPRLLATRASQPDPALTAALTGRAEAARDLRQLGMAVPTSTPINLARPVTSAAGSPAGTRPVPPASSVAGSAPLCPQCGSRMVRRTARRGARSGRQFWGCVRYPNCRGTRN
jgi:DNA-binding helix-hairpin-helix protein with protein kinase domain